ncbi:glycosyltransferase family 2 protein [Frigidibacter oleivorans]|uniref:glycosyltransferase family 2 protein n=1 Tax=Frigidibacter oleivorans TaxID=2487129 RepID=UPI0013DE8285|nr:glycosyltransferase family 2 protein [Frigidibacter oleivorans]
MPDPDAIPAAADPVPALPPDPRVSVILPVYNRAASLAPALDSVLAQTVPPHEVIVVDDGSTDGIMAALAPYAGRIRLIRQANAGVAAARNTGLAAATGDWIAFQDSDDLWTPGHLAAVARDLAAAPADVVCHLGDVHYLGEGYREGLFAIKGRQFPPDRAERVDDALPLVISGMTLQAAAIRADVLRRMGGFDTGMRMLSDTALFCLLALEGPFLVTAAPMADIIRLPGDGDSITSLTRKDPAYARQMHCRYLQALAARPLSPARRALVERMLSGAEFRLAQALHPAEPADARRLAIRAARRHPRPLTGWAKALLALLFGQRGYAWVLDRSRPLDRS